MMPRRVALLLYVAPVSVFYLVFLVVPYALVLRLSIFRFSTTRLYLPEVTAANYLAVLTDPFYLGLVARTLGLGLVVTLVSLGLGYPLALRIVRAGPGLKRVLLAVTVSPLLINLVVRSYAWLVLLGDHGVLNTGLQRLGLIGAPLPLGGTMLSVTLGLVHICLPLMILSLLGALEAIDPALIDAATSLGASRAKILRRVVVPLSWPGVGAGSLLVFTFAISAFITPSLLGGNRVSTLGTLIYEKFTFAANWPMGATLVMVLLLINVGVIALHGRLFRTA